MNNKVLNVIEYIKKSIQIETLNYNKEKRIIIINSGYYLLSNIIKKIDVYGIYEKNYKNTYIYNAKQIILNT